MSNLLVRTLGNDGKSLSTSQPDERVVTPENLISRLKNKKIVFFTGAGFSIAWNGSYPDGYRLFLIDDIEAVKENHNFFKVASLLHINEPNIESTNYKSDCLNFFKEIKFHLDIYKRYPSLLPSYLDKTIVQQLENEIRDFIK
ncbi:hypothetical protein LF025_004264, partial [Vibrio vulnificus]|nr:hypothetical protein [Vibrio vulnificus]